MAFSASYYFVTPISAPPRERSGASASKDGRQIPNPRQMAYGLPHPRPVGTWLGVFPSSRPAVCRSTGLRVRCQQALREELPKSLSHGAYADSDRQ